MKTLKIIDVIEAVFSLYFDETYDLEFDVSSHDKVIK